MPAACEPDVNGVPDFVRELLCGDTDPALLWGWVAAHPGALLTVAAALLALRPAWATARAAAAWRHSHQATWWEITPPVTATPAATLALWRLLATLLQKPKPWTLTPTRLAWEVHATTTQTRCGLWVPPGVSPAGVRQAVQRAWPGARLEHTTAPRLPNRTTACALRLATNQPTSAPAVEDHATHPTGPATGSETDLARAVYDATAAAGRGGFGLLQIIVTRASPGHIAALRRAGRDPTRARQHQPGTQLATLLLRGVQEAVRTGLDLFTPSGHTGPEHSREQHGRQQDPHLTEEARQARTRLGAGPLFLVAVRAAAAAPNPAAARAAADDITAGFGLHSPHFHRRRLRLTRHTIQTRHSPTRHLRLATAPEAAALLRVPFEPALYGLPTAAARRRAPAVGTWTATTPPPDIP